MKTLSLILAAMVLCLSLRPGVESVQFLMYSQSTCTGSVCTHTEDADLSDDGDNEEENSGCCSIYKACCASFFYFSNFDFTIKNWTDISTDDGFGYKSLLSHPYVTDFWQPPRHV